MDNTIENKARFFALYWGQEVGRKSLSYWTRYVEIDYINQMSTSRYAERYFLELKPISLITDEDLIAIESNLQGKGTHFTVEITADNYKNHWVAKYGDNVMKGYFALKDFDYLRSKGYALPFMGLSVETMIEYGWIKLKTK